MRDKWSERFCEKFDAEISQKRTAGRFGVSPFQKNVARALLKEPKYYFYDNAMVIGDDGVRLENLVACALQKEAHRLEDVEGEKRKIQFIRDKDGREVDFLITQDQRPEQLIEVKWSDEKLSTNLQRFLSSQQLRRTQVVAELKQTKSYPTGERIISAVEFLRNFTLAG